MENNRKILQEALRGLSEFSPADAQWERLKELLDNSIETNPLKNLSQFVPPDMVWLDIDEKLSNRAHRTRMTMIVNWSVAAAAILVLGVIIFNTININHSKLKFAEIFLTESDISNWNKDDVIIDQAIEQICAANPDICLSEEFKTLEKELEFLNKTKQTILNQMNPYESRTDLEQLITKIELEQTAIINQLVEIIN